MNEAHALRMAELMTEMDAEIREAILTTQRAGHGVVALRFSDGATRMDIEILDETPDGNVRIYPGE